MDVSKITDLQQLKAMVYDEIVTKERAENNMKIINARIAEILSNPPQPPITAAPSPTNKPKGKNNEHKPAEETSKES